MGSKGWVAGKGPGPHKSCRPSVCSTDTLSALACQSPTLARPRSTEVSCGMGIHAPQATHSPLRDWGPAASHQLRTGTGDSVPSHWLGTDWGLGTQSPARGLGLGTESSADARDCCGTGHWSPGLSHLKILILTAMSLDITTEL